MTDNSDEIAAELAKARQELATAKTTWQIQDGALKEVKRQLAEAQLIYDNLNRERIIAQNALEDIKYSVAKLPGKIKQLEDALAKKLLEEQTRLSIEQSLREFKERTLSASWREENRTDGRGAKKHQIDGGYTLALNSGGYLFDKRGLGKTLTSLVAADLLDAAKVVIVVPNDVASQYVKEINRWTPHRQVVPFYQLNKIQRDMWFSILQGLQEWTIVINYEAWRRDWGVVEEINKLQPTCLIADEAHNINKTDMKQWQGVWYIRSHPNKCPKCSGNNIFYDSKIHRVICQTCGEFGEFNNSGRFSDATLKWLSVTAVIPMTGSPFLNRPQELYPLLRLCQPDKFFNEAEYERQYCLHLRGSRFTWAYGGQERLLAQIKDRLVQRDRKSAGVVIPPQDVQIHELILDPEKYPSQARALEQIRNYAQLVMDDNETVLNMTIFLEVLLRLRQGIEWPAGIKLSVKEFNEALQKKIVVSEQHLEVYESIKIDWTEELIKQLVDEGERVLVFSHFISPLEELSRRLRIADIKHIQYTGSTPEYLKRRAKDDFDPNTCGNNPQYSVLLGHYRSAGTGLNLHAATQTILLGEEWNPGKEDQAMGRTDRIGTTRETTVHIPRVTNSVADQFMATLLEEKSNTVGAFDSAAKQIQALRDTLHRKDLL